LKRALLSASALLLLAAQAQAWPSETMIAIGRDARRLLPGSLSRLLADREKEVQQEAARLAPELARALARDLPAGALQPDTLALVDGEVDGIVLLLRERRVGEGLVRLGALLRVVADLSDPVLAVGPEGWPPGLEREYYALFAANFDKMPVVLDDPRALELSRRELGGLLQSLVLRSREQAPTIRAELVRGGRVVSHTALDFRSPAWAVASLAYSRAVTGTAATWLAVWREVRGDTTSMPRAREVTPRPEPSLVNDRRSLQPEAP
jgi:predicted Rdx family selenoprotein